jgi:hypothetical protein
MHRLACPQPRQRRRVRPNSPRPHRSPARKARRRQTSRRGVQTSRSLEAGAVRTRAECACDVEATAARRRRQTRGVQTVDGLQRSSGVRCTVGAGVRCCRLCAVAACTTVGRSSSARCVRGRAAAEESRSRASTRRDSAPLHTPIDDRSCVQQRSGAANRRTHAVCTCTQRCALE